MRLLRDVVEVERLPADTGLLSASFPCGDVSRAGTRGGSEFQSSNTGGAVGSSRTGLVRHVFRLLGDPSGPRVPWVLLENVPGLLDRSGEDEPTAAEKNPAGPDGPA